MPDLLLELFSEEIPARMQARAAENLRKLVTDGLVEAGLVYEGAKAFATPRRLALTVHGVPARSPDRREERKGPRVGAPDKAIAGFVKAAGLASIDDAEIRPDKKGDIYVAVIEQVGSTAEDVIAEIVPKAIRGFPWPKSMRWGAASAKPGSLCWVRPLHSVLCVFGPETEDTAVVPFDIDGIASGDVTHGHRFMAPGPISVRRFDDYGPKLEAAKVVLDAERRKDMIRADARDRALALGLEVVEDEALLDEVAGLVEWPVVLVGRFEEAFLEIPPEVVRATIRANQKCFVLRNPGNESFETRPQSGLTPPIEPGVGSQDVDVGDTEKRGTGEHQRSHPEAPPKAASKSLPPARSGDARPARLANRFVMVANIEAPDGGDAIVAGNERVIRARLADARHFWQTDRAPLADYREANDKPLDQRLAKLRALNIIFHDKLGTQGERVERIARLAKEIAPLVSANPELAERAATLAKADLVTEMVGEFPELQGLMGRYYATAQAEHPAVAAAIEDHYKPAGPSDRVPTEPVAIAVSLADKVDTLVGFWAIDEKPTGSKDPYALRRAALGVIRIVLENAIRVDLRSLLVAHLEDALRRQSAANPAYADYLKRAYEPTGDRTPDFDGHPSESDHARHVTADARSVAADLLSFFHDRLKVQLREQGARHDLVDAVLSQEAGSAPRVSLVASPRTGSGATGTKGGDQDDLLQIVRRVEALGRFLDTDDGSNLLAGSKRAANILREEEKKDGVAHDGDVDPTALREPEEKALFEAIGAAGGEVIAAVEVEDYDDAMRALARLRGPVDTFFDTVLVNDSDAAVRVNRLRLLNRIRTATRAVADFSKIEG